MRRRAVTAPAPPRGAGTVRAGPRWGRWSAVGARARRRAGARGPDGTGCGWSTPRNNMDTRPETRAHTTTHTTWTHTCTPPAPNESLSRRAARGLQRARLALSGLSTLHPPPARARLLTATDGQAASPHALARARGAAGPQIAQPSPGRVLRRPSPTAAGRKRPSGLCEYAVNALLRALTRARRAHSPSWRRRRE